MFTVPQRQELLNSLLADICTLNERAGQDETAAQQLQSLIAGLLQIGESLDPALEQQRQRILVAAAERANQARQAADQMEAERQRISAFVPGNGQNRAPRRRSAKSR